MQSCKKNTMIFLRRREDLYMGTTEAARRRVRRAPAGTFSDLRLRRPSARRPDSSLASPFGWCTRPGSQRALLEGRQFSFRQGTSRCFCRRHRPGQGTGSWTYRVVGDTSPWSVDSSSAHCRTGCDRSSPEDGRSSLPTRNNTARRDLSFQRSLSSRRCGSSLAMPRPISLNWRRRSTLLS